MYFKFVLTSPICYALCVLPRTRGAWILRSWGMCLVVVVVAQLHQLLLVGQQLCTAVKSGIFNIILSWRHVNVNTFISGHTFSTFQHRRNILDRDFYMFCQARDGVRQDFGLSAFCIVVRWTRSGTRECKYLVFIKIKFKLRIT